MGFSEKLKIMLNQSKAFKVYMFHKDKRVSQHIVIPKDGKFKLKGNGYIINPQRIFFEKRTPCSVYASAIAEPINPLMINELSNLSSQDFYNAIEATVVQDIIRSTNKSDNTMMLVMGLSLITFVAVLGIAFYLGGLIEQQNTVINAILDSLKSSTPDIPYIPGVR